MTSFVRPRRLIAVCALATVGAAAQANDFPTADRVNYVLDCMRTYPGQRFEMSSKCSCAIDHIANEVSFDDFVTMSTVAKAISIGGERGSSIRDAPSLEPQVKRYRDLVARAETACFLRPPSR